MRCIECLGDDTETFDFAWANCRLGLLSDDPATAEEYFRKSSYTFRLLHYEQLYGRSEGERAVSLVQLDRASDFVRIIERMCRHYYLRAKSYYAPVCTIGIAQLIRLRSTLERKPIPDHSIRSYPKFERGVYQNILDDAKPEASGLVAFYSLAKIYDLLDNAKRKVRCLRTALRCETTIQLDKDSKPMVVRELLSEIILSGNKSEIKKAMTQAMFTKMSETRNTLEFLSFCVFSPFDNVFPKLSEFQKDDFSVLFDEIETALKDVHHGNEGWWLAEIYLRKARLAEGRLGRAQKGYLWNLAYQYGYGQGNHEMTCQAAHKVGFNYVELSSSLRELAEVQLNLIKAISLQGRDFERLEAVGINLFNFWRAIDFRKLSEYDLKAKQSLLDGAKSLKNAGYQPDDAGPIMILLLSEVYDYSGPCTDWARKKAKEIKHTIPKWVHEKIACYL